MGLVVNVLKAVTERAFVIDIQDLLTTLSTDRSDMFYKKKTCWMHFNVSFNIDISISAIYDRFDIHELAEFTVGSSFFILLEIAF